MISSLLPAIRKALAADCSSLNLSCPEKDANGKDTSRPPRVYIGDFPAKRQSGQEAREFPCIVLSPVSGFSSEGQEFCDIAAFLCVYNNEQGDAEGLEMELAQLQGAVSRFIVFSMFHPVDRRYQVVADEKSRIYRWQRNSDLETPRPYLQMAVISRWSMPGWQYGGHLMPPHIPPGFPAGQKETP